MDFVLQSLLRQYYTEPTDELAHRIVALTLRKNDPHERVALRLIYLSRMADIYLETAEFFDADPSNLEMIDATGDTENQLIFRLPITYKTDDGQLVSGTMDLRTDPPLSDTGYVDDIQIYFKPGEDLFIGIYFQGLSGDDDNVFRRYAWTGPEIFEDGDDILWNGRTTGIIHHFKLLWNEYQELILQHLSIT